MKSLFNEAELFLLEKWADARQLEDSMKEVRKKYQEIGQRIVTEVTAAHPTLDFPAVCLTQNWDNGYIGIGKRIWPDEGDKAPSGLYVGYLRLEFLTSDQEEPPTAYIWIPKSAKVGPTSARLVLDELAKSELTTEEYRQVTFEESAEVCMWFPAPSRQGLRSALFEGDGRPFVDLVVKQFEVLARFIPGLDTLLLKAT